MNTEKNLDKNTNILTNETQDWYKRYYEKKGTKRNNLFNPEVTFQHLAYEKCFLAAFKDVSTHSKIIDIGGGDGGDLLNLIKCGFNPNLLTLIDILPERIAKAKEKLINTIGIFQHDASKMKQFEDNTYDVAFSSTMFIQLCDNTLAKSIAQEMIRIVRTNGKIFIFDWRYDFWKNEYLAADKNRIKNLFSVGHLTTLEKRIKGQLIPPLGRFLSKRFPSFYFLAQRIPFATGLFCYILTKN